MYAQKVGTAQTGPSDTTLVLLPVAPVAYIDDVLVASSSVEEHKLQLQLVSEHFCESLVNASKCEFGAPSLQFLLRHIIDKDGIHPLDTKVATMRYFPHPSSRWQLQKFLGMINFYQCFIPHCAQALQLLHTLLTHQWRMKVIIIGGAETFN